MGRKQLVDRSLIFLKILNEAIINVFFNLEEGLNDLHYLKTPSIGVYSKAWD